MKSYEHPLSSDAWSSWQQCDPRVAELNLHVVQATDALEIHVAKFADAIAKDIIAYNTRFIKTALQSIQTPIFSEAYVPSECILILILVDL